MKRAKKDTPSIIPPGSPHQSPDGDTILKNRFEGVSDGDLQRELNRRREEELQRKKAEFDAKWEQQELLLNSDNGPLILDLLLKHSKTSCSDENTYGWHPDGWIECTRCAYLEGRYGEKRILLELTKDKLEP